MKAFVVYSGRSGHGLTFEQAYVEPVQQAFPDLLGKFKNWDADMEQQDERKLFDLTSRGSWRASVSVALHVLKYAHSPRSDDPHIHDIKTASRKMLSFFIQNAHDGGQRRHDLFNNILLSPEDKADGVLKTLGKSHPEFKIMSEIFKKIEKDVCDEAFKNGHGGSGGRLLAGPSPDVF